VSATVEDVGPPLPILGRDQILNISAARDAGESLYFPFVVLANLGVLAALVLLAVKFPEFLAVVALYAALFAVVAFVAWKLTYAFIFGNSIRVGRNQYPQLYRLVKEAAHRLGISEPTVLVLQGHGYVEMLLAKRFTRRGVILLTSNLFDSLKDRTSSREMMMIVGRQLGHIAAGHYRMWFFKDIIGRLSLWFHAAWRRRCHFTADRIGLLVAGDLLAAQQALLVMTVGDNLARGADLDEVQKQRDDLFDSFWSWLRLAFEDYPFIVDRIVRLRSFANAIATVRGGENQKIGALALEHRSIRPIPLMILHGHDRMSLLELKTFLFERLPNVRPIVMAAESRGSSTLPEKFEGVATQVEGAIALLTPDDLGACPSNRA